jgi:spore coat protein U domain-containing protein, fimbrial subunit CupE1/2/3/6
MRTCLALSLALCVLARPSEASAMECSIRSVSGLVFGSYNVFSGTPLDTSGAIIYRCTGVAGADSLIIQLTSGNAGTFASSRALLDGAFRLDYNIYLDAARSTVWGDGSAGTNQHGPVQPVEAADTSVAVFGRIPPRQNARAGSYTDTVIVTIVF